MTRVIEPAKGRVLVKLGASLYGDIPVPPKDYDSSTYGLIIKVNPEDEKEYGKWVGRIGYWKLYKDDLKISDELGGDKIAVIPISDVDSTSYEE
jgi:hypothetical protein